MARFAERLALGAMVVALARLTVVLRSKHSEAIMLSVKPRTPLLVLLAAG